MPRGFGRLFKGRGFSSRRRAQRRAQKQFQRRVAKQKAAYDREKASRTPSVYDRRADAAAARARSIRASYRGSYKGPPRSKLKYRRASGGRGHQGYYGDLVGAALLSGAFDLEELGIDIDDFELLSEDEILLATFDLPADEWIPYGSLGQGVEQVRFDTDHEGMIANMETRFRGGSSKTYDYPFDDKMVALVANGRGLTKYLLDNYGGGGTTTQAALRGASRSVRLAAQAVKYFNAGVAIGRQIGRATDLIRDVTGLGRDHLPSDPYLDRD